MVNCRKLSRLYRTVSSIYSPLPPRTHQPPPHTHTYPLRISAPVTTATPAETMSDTSSVTSRNLQERQYGAQREAECSEACAAGLGDISSAVQGAPLPFPSKRGVQSKHNVRHVEAEGRARDAELSARLLQGALHECEAALHAALGLPLVRAALIGKVGGTC